MTFQGNNSGTIQETDKPAFQEAVQAIFGEGVSAKPETIDFEPPPTRPAAPSHDEPGGPKDSLRRAREALQQGDWEGFGRAMQELQRRLE